MLVRLGLVNPGVLLETKEGPIWPQMCPEKGGEQRVKMLKETQCHADKETATFAQCETARGIWKIKSHGRIMGYCVVYAGNVLSYAPTKWAKTVMNTFESMWECKLVGIIVRDEESTALAVDKLAFLSITIEPIKDGFALHQHEYVQTKLANRAMTKGRPNRPQVDGGHVCPVTQEYKNTNEYQTLLNNAQQEVGSPQWLALKTKPDITCITAIRGEHAVQKSTKSVGHHR